MKQWDHIHPSIVCYHDTTLITHFYATALLVITSDVMLLVSPNINMRAIGRPIG